MVIIISIASIILGFVISHIKDLDYIRDLKKTLEEQEEEIKELEEQSSQYYQNGLHWCEWNTTLRNQLNWEERAHNATIREFHNSLKEKDKEIKVLQEKVEELNNLLKLVV